MLINVVGGELTRPIPHQEEEKPFLQAPGRKKKTTANSNIKNNNPTVDLYSENQADQDARPSHTQSAHQLNTVLFHTALPVTAAEGRGIHCHVAASAIKLTLSA